MKTATNKTTNYDAWVKAWKDKEREKLVCAEMKEEIEKRMHKEGNVWTDEAKKPQYVLGTKYDHTVQKYVMKEYERKEYVANNVEDYITLYYVDITKSIVKCMARNEKSISFSACYEIVKSGFRDSIFEDLSQEIALFLCENKDSIAPCSYVKTKNPSFSLNELFIDCFGIVQNYLYRNKQRHENRLYVITDMNEYTQNDIIDVLGSVPERQNALDNKEFSTTLDTFSRLLIKYAKEYHTKEQSDKLLNVWRYMMKYATQKQIASITGYSKNTVSKYRQEIIDCWTAFTRYTDKQKTDCVNITDFQKMMENACYEAFCKLESKARETLDFNGITRHYNVDITICEVSKEHAEKSRFYNDIFTRGDRTATANHASHIYND